MSRAAFAGMGSTGGQRRWAAQVGSAAAEGAWASLTPRDAETSPS